MTTRERNDAPVDDGGYRGPVAHRAPDAHRALKLASFDCARNRLGPRRELDCREDPPTGEPRRK
jgi:hypothetical protein